MSDQSRLQLPSLSLGMQCWGPEDGLPVLALHGWLDNSSSFVFLAQELLKHCPNLRIIALDLPGHGHSDHSRREFGFFFVNYVNIVFQILNSLGLQKCVMLGHSMGAAAVALAAGTIPEKFSHMILIDAIGPASAEEKQAPMNYHNFIEISNQRVQRHGQKKIYSEKNFASLVHKRSLLSGISKESAKILLERNMTKTSQGYSWNTDPSLHNPSPLFLTEGQVCAFLKKIEAKTLILLANNKNTEFMKKDRILLEYSKKFKKRSKHIRNATLYDNLEGGHHLHMEKASMLSQHINQWLQKNPIT